MAVNQRQSLACMQGDCHATETPKDRAANHREPTDSTFSILASTSWDYAFQHAFRPRLPTYHSDRGRYVFGQNWLYCWSWRCAALSYQLHFHLLLTEKTNNVTTPNCCLETIWI